MRGLSGSPKPRTSRLLFICCSMGGETSKKLREHVDRLADNDSGFVEVNWEGLKIGDRGVAALSEALRTNTRLRNLRLGGCAITQVGARSLTDAICQSQNNRVRKLDFVSDHAYRGDSPRLFAKMFVARAITSW